jgi:O-antigen/teichoic acid export membrane protein
MRDEGASDYNALKRHLLAGVKISTIIAGYIGGMIIVYGKFFILEWVGASYMESFTVLVILTVSMTITMSQFLSISVLQSVNKHKFFAVTNWIEALSNLLITFLLVRPFGIVGVALGTAIPMVVVKMILQPYVVCISIGMPLRYYIKNLYYMMVFIGAFIGLNYHIVHAIFVEISYFRIAAYVAASGMLYSVMVYLLVFDPVERTYLGANVRKMLNFQ